jgi:hypothetical protein
MTKEYNGNDNEDYSLVVSDISSSILEKDLEETYLENSDE